MMTIIINGMILLLLVGAIGYTYLVDSRVRKLLLTLKELEPMVGQFSKAVEQSQSSLEKFKNATKQKAPTVKAKQKAPTVKAANKTSNAAVSENTLTFETSRKPKQKPIGQISSLGKSELVRSFFATAETSEL